MKKNSVLVGSRALSGCAAMLVLVAGMAGCSVSASPGPAPVADTCGKDSSVGCSVGTGWSCTGSAEPEDVNSNLVCNTDGAGDFCCVSSSCSFDTSVKNCPSGADGYSCAAGAPAPDQADATLVCSEPADVDGADAYCCFTNTVTPSGTSTCAEDPTVNSCQPDSAGNPSFGFSCTGDDSPDGDFSNVSCSGGVDGTDSQGNAATLFCCTYQ